MLRSLLLGLIVMVVGSGCALLPPFPSRHPGKYAFIAYWPGEAEGGRLRLAIKDNIDMKGVVTTVGSEYLAKTYPPAKHDAPCLEIARERGVAFVGKTNLSEFAVSPSGFNEYFGTPISPLSGWRKLVPGGSSCGSAVAVAVGLADVAFGTDTAGSIRVPAACCGVVGLKTTFGLVPLDGIYPIEAVHLDTVGPIGRNVAQTVRGMDLLQEGFVARYEAARVAHPTAAKIRVGRLTLEGTDPKIDRAIDAALGRAGFEVIPLSDDFREKWEQAKKDGNTIAASGAWISVRKYQNKPGVSVRTKSAILVGQFAYQNSYQEALSRRRSWQRTIERVFDKVDFIALPTLQTTPPLLPVNLKIGLLEARMLELQNTVPVNFSGNPALAVPVPIRHAGVRVTSLQLIGPHLSEAALLNAGRLLEQAMK